MRHFVNVALVFFFVTLVVTGLLRFFFPFSLVTTRVHIVFGFGVLVLVGLHLASRTKYFLRVAQTAFAEEGGRRTVVSQKSLMAVVGLWIVLVGTALWNYPPVTQLIDLSYESRHRATIFRPDDRTVYKPVNEGLRVKRATESDAELLVKVDWGSIYPVSDRRGPPPFSGARPQVAIWTEGETGSLIETLYLSEKAAFNESFRWAGHSLDRVDVLPIWRHRYTLKTGVAPDGDQVAYSGATPEHSFSVHSYLRTDSKPFYLYVEVNVPSDSNSFYHPRHKPDHAGYVKPGIGQPSILYGAYIEPTKEKQYALLDLVGHGGSSSSRDGNIHYDTQHLSTAKKLVEKILIRVQRVEPKKDSSKVSGRMP